MKLHKILTRRPRSAGFTLIEVLVAIAIFSILVAMGLFLSMDVWRGSSFQSEQDLVLSLLYKARSRAVANINESDHGLHIDPEGGRYVIYEGDTYEEDDNNLGFDINADVVFEGDKDIIFGARDARTDGFEFSMSGQGHQRTFLINAEGGITWE